MFSLSAILTNMLARTCIRFHIVSTLGNPHDLIVWAENVETLFVSTFTKASIFIYPKNVETWLK